MKQLISIFLLLFITACSNDKSADIISDQEAINFSKKHRTELKDLVHDIEKLPKLERIRLTSEKLEILPKGMKVPIKVIETMSQAKIELIDIKIDKGELKYIEFILSASGNVLSGEVKGVLYTPIILNNNLYDDLDEFRRGVLRKKTIESTVGYRQLSKNFYIFYYVSF